MCVAPVSCVCSVVKLTVINSHDVEEEEGGGGGAVNDSDASPPQSRGRGRLEKGRGKAASRGQSEESRSTSSQAAEEESSSHVKTFLCARWRICRLLNVLRLSYVASVCSIPARETGHPFEPVPETAASAAASVTPARRRTKPGACSTPTTPKRWPHTTGVW